MQSALDAGEYITITVDDEEYRFSYSDKNNDTKEILKNANQGDYVEIEMKGGKPVDIRYAEQR